MTQMSKNVELWRVQLRNGTCRSVIFVLLNDGSMPSLKEWLKLDGQVKKKFRNRFNTVLHAETLTSLNDQIFRDLGDGIHYLKMKDPRWRAFCFVDGTHYHVTDFLFNPSNRDIAAAKERAVKRRRSFVTFTGVGHFDKPHIPR